jgi:RNA polymerase sigma-70 factor (ECF subfamily)
LLIIHCSFFITRFSPFAGSNAEDYPGCVMYQTDSDPRPQPEAAWRFASTRWSMVAAAGQRDSPESAEALATLCQAYWYPLYSYARRRLTSATDAQDATQAFFAELLAKNYLLQADPARGRFRSFLLTAFKHFLSKDRDRATAKKRGGDRQILSLDFPAGERRYCSEPVDAATPETLFERRWALTLLEQTLTRLRNELSDSGKSALFQGLKETLTCDSPSRPYADIAEELGISEPAVKVAVHRLRRRYQELLRAEIAQTVNSPEEIDDELRDLFAAVRARV